MIKGGRGGDAREEEEEGETSEDASPVSVGGLSPLTLTHSFSAMPHLHPKQALLLTAVTSSGLGVRWDSQTRCSRTGATQSGEGGKGEPEDAETGLGEPLAQPGCRNGLAEGRGTCARGPGLMGDLELLISWKDGFTPFQLVVP